MVQLTAGKVRKYMVYRKKKYVLKGGKRLQQALKVIHA